MRVFALQCSWFSLTSLWLVCEHAYTCHGGNLVHDSTAPLADKAEVRKPGCKWVNRETMELCLLFEDGNPKQGVLVESALFEDNGKEYGGGGRRRQGEGTSKCGRCAINQGHRHHLRQEKGGP